MLINLSNHPHEGWHQSQLDVAKSNYGEIISLPFPDIAPEQDLASVQKKAKKLVRSCLKLFIEKADNFPNAVHIMGEMTFVYNFVKQMSEKGLMCIASTTKRVVSKEDNGMKVSQFMFVQFRAYFD